MATNLNPRLKTKEEYTVNETEIHHQIPRSLLRLYDICFWSEDAANEPYPVNDPKTALSEALNAFEMECRRYGIDHMNVSRGMLEMMIRESEVELSWQQHRHEAHAGDWARWGRRGGLAVLKKYGRDHFRMLALKRWGKEAS